VTNSNTDPTSQHFADMAAKTRKLICRIPMMCSIKGTPRTLEAQAIS